jgi:2-amino-4-hydroxy-6-hydroxymethyldihydropteridine diphosphokinase
MQTAYIGMGGNLASRAGTPEQTLAAAALRLASLGRVTRRSSLYSTEPVGFADQARFVNAVVELQTDLEPRALLNGLLTIEQEFGRNRAASFTNGPRTLDLDILLLGQLQVVEPDLKIPHPRMTERLFVLVPLCELVPRRVDAVSGRTMSQLLQHLESSAGSEGNAVVPIQSSAWRADARRNAGPDAGPDASPDAGPDPGSDPGSSKS